MQRHAADIFVAEDISVAQYVDGTWKSHQVLQYDAVSIVSEMLIKHPPERFFILWLVEKVVRNAIRKGEVVARVSVEDVAKSFVQMLYLVNKMILRMMSANPTSQAY